MNFYDLDILSRGLTGSALTNLYNLFDPTFQYLINIAVYTYTVPVERQMRIDSISNDIYGSTDYCDFILDLNNIRNPLNIMNNDVLLYVSPDQIQFFQLDNTTATKLRNTYLNANKVSSPDVNRSAYILNNYALPPTFLTIPSSAVSINNGMITLGGNS